MEPFLHRSTASIKMPLVSQAEKVTFTAATLRLDIAQASVTDDGVLSKDGKELKGVWHEGKDRDLIFKRVSDL